MNFEVITSMNEEMYNKFGSRMIESFITKWPSTIKLTIYKEVEDSFNLNSERISTSSILEDPSYLEFINRHKNRSDQSNPLELHKGAIRFAAKSFSVFTHCLSTKIPYVIWLDADTETFNEIPESFFHTLVREGVYTTFLGRKNNYSECGFVIYNTIHPKNEDFMEEWRTLYDLDRIFMLDQWHDSFIFDWLRKRHLDEYEELNLSPWGENYDHVFNNSIIGAYIDHKKGSLRKKLGYSFYEDLDLRIATKEAIQRYKNLHKPKM